MNYDFSVLMSIYKKESPYHLKECMDSILSQTLVPNEIVIVKDGPLTPELEKILDEYQKSNPDLYTIISLETNQGLGYALAEGITHCKYELIARMDTDDVARNDRFENQIAEFRKDSRLDICGSHIVEFEGNLTNFVASRRVPLNDDDIKQYQKRRDGFNHVTVMYKKSMVLKAGNYKSCLLMEDTLLWVNMILAGAKCKNIDDYLVYVRVGSDMFRRRGGYEYFKKYKNGRKRVRETKYISSFDYYYTIFIQFIIAMIPNKIRKWIFIKLLH